RHFTETAVHSRQMAAAVDRPRHDRRPLARTLRPRTLRRPVRDGSRRDLDPHWAGPSGDDVPGTRDGPLRQDRRGYWRQEAPGLILTPQLARWTRCNVRPGMVLPAGPVRVPK